MNMNMKNLNLKNYKKIQVHGGTFHADDVMCALLAKRANPEVEILRGGEPLIEDSNTLVADYGNTEFDHHDQSNIKTYNDGIKLSACGLLMKKFGEELFPDEYIRETIVKNIIRGIDAVDNGQPDLIQPNLGTSLCHIVDCYNPNWDKNSNGNTEFLEALKVVESIFNKELARLESKIKAQKIIKDTYNRANDKQILIFDKFVPATEYLSENMEDVLFYIFPSNRGGYCLLAVPPKGKPFEQRCPISDQETIEGVTFIHPAHFIAGGENVACLHKLANASMQKTV